MIYTEEEAKTKWCPMVSFLIGPHNDVWQNHGYTNRAEYFEPNGVKCIASGCMFWGYVKDGMGSGACGKVYRFEGD